jgi:branched-chain amino acid transport system substrate-binding protein
MRGSHSRKRSQRVMNRQQSTSIAGALRERVGGGGTRKTGLHSRCMLALALLLAAALLGDPASAKGETAGAASTDRHRAGQREIRLGMSADFSASARGLSIELYRGITAYLLPVNNAGGVNGRRVTVTAYDDQYEPDLAIRNTLRLMDKDEVFALFSYVGTPTMNRVLPLLQMHQDKDFLLFFPFTGADTNRIPPYDHLSFNLRASYDQETKGLVDHFIAVNRTRIGVFYQADAYGRAGWAGLREALGKRGLEIAGEATYRRGSPFDQSYDRQVAIMQRVQPDAVVVSARIPPAPDSSATCATEASIAPSRRSHSSAARPCSSCYPPPSES